MTRLSVVRGMVLLGAVVAFAGTGHKGARAADGSPQTYGLPAICLAPGTPQSKVRELEEFYARQQPDMAFRLGTTWASTATTPSRSQGDPVVIRWSIVPDGTPLPSGVGEPAANSNLKAFLNGVYVSESNWLPLFVAVFNSWGALSGATYIYEPNDDGAPHPSSSGVINVRGDVRIGGHLIDGDFGILAYNYFPNQGDMVIDTGDIWYATEGTNNGSLGFKNMLAHEHGHGLGVNHVCPVDMTKLMEPLISLNFNGLQHDDILAGQRGYGDDKEPNDTAATATLISGGSPLPDGPTGVPGTISVDDDADPDYYKFFVPTNKRVDVTLTPVGFTYLEGPQVSGSCTAGTSYNTLTKSNLTLQLIGSDGTTVLGFANNTGAGSSEVLNDVLLPGTGPFYVRVSGAADDVQLYTVSLNVEVGGPALSVNDVAVAENAGNATFTVTLSPVSGQVVTVQYATSAGTAAAASDYTHTTGILTFSAGQSSKPVAVPIVNDTLDELSEAFTLNLSSAVNAPIIDPQGTGTINDDDPPPVITVDDALSVTEGNSGTVAAVFTVRISTASGLPVAVSYTTASGTATSGVDFTAVTSSVNITPGLTSVPVVVSVIGDTVDEVDEDFFLNLSSPVNASIADSQAKATIVDDDGKPAICTPFSSLPLIITAQGRYCLTQNVSTNQTTGAAITVNTNFVEIDLKGFKVGGGGAGFGTQTVGVYALNRKNISIKNGNIRGFLRGVFLEDTNASSQGHLVQGLRADENTLAGIHVQGKGNIVRNNQVVKTTGTTTLGANANTFGIVADGPGARVLNNDVSDTIGVGTGTAFSVYVTTATGTVIERNRVGNSVLAAASTGIRAVSGASVMVVANRMAIFGKGVDMTGASGKYRANVTTGITTPYTGGTDAGNNN